VSHAMAKPGNDIDWVRALFMIGIVVVAVSLFLSGLGCVLVP